MTWVDACLPVCITHLRMMLVEILANAFRAPHDDATCDNEEEEEKSSSDEDEESEVEEDDVDMA